MDYCFKKNETQHAFFQKERATVERKWYIWASYAWAEYKPLPLKACTSHINYMTYFPLTSIYFKLVVIKF